MLQRAVVDDESLVTNSQQLSVELTTGLAFNQLVV